MIIKGATRKDGGQLGDYLLDNANGQNDDISILEIRAGQTRNAKNAIIDMDLATGRTKRGVKGLYHAQINPAIGEDKKMTEADWLLCADILEEDLGLTGQSRVLVRHQKRGEDGILRDHLHVVWQREKDCKLIKMNHNYRKHDRSRERMEIALQHARTCQPEQIKEQLSYIWHNSTDAQDFINKAYAKGFQIGKGDRRAFTVTTPDGKKHDLVRQLKKIKTHEVKSRLESIAATLPDDKHLTGKKPEREKQNKRRYRTTTRAEKVKTAREKETISTRIIPEPARERYQDKAREAKQSFDDITRPQPQPETTQQKAEKAAENFKETTQPAEKKTDNVIDFKTHKKRFTANKQATELKAKENFDKDKAREDLNRRIDEAAENLRNDDFGLEHEL